MQSHVFFGGECHDRRHTDFLNRRPAWRPSDIVSAMPFVPAINAYLRRAIEFFGLIYILSLFTFIGLLAYTGHAGIARPDATHTVRMTDHGRAYYLTIWQSRCRFWAGVMMGASGAVAVLSSLLADFIKRSRRS